MDTASWRLYARMEHHDLLPIVTNSSLSLRGSPPGTAHHLGGRFGRRCWIAAQAGDRDGSPEGEVSAGLEGLGIQIQAKGLAATAQERWLFLKSGTSDSLAATWHSLRYGGSAELGVFPMRDLRLHGTLGIERFRPRDASGWCLGDSGTATQWSMDAEDRLSAGILNGEISMRTARLATLGWHQDDDDRRLFHEEDWEFTQRSARLRWSPGAWSFEGGAERSRLELSHAANGTPFLSWNALDGSSWMPLLSVMESRSDFLSGTASLRRLWFETDREFDLPRLKTRLRLHLEDAQADGDFLWHQRDAVFLFLASQLDTTAFSMHLVLLRLELELSSPLWKQLRITGGASATIPLWYRSSNVHRQASTGSEASEASSGGWQVHAGLVWHI